MSSPAGDDGRFAVRVLKDPMVTRSTHMPPPMFLHQADDLANLQRHNDKCALHLTPLPRDYLSCWRRVIERDAGRHSNCDIVSVILTSLLV